MNAPMVLSRPLAKSIIRQTSVINGFSRTYLTKAIQQPRILYRLAIFDIAELLPIDSLTEANKNNFPIETGDVVEVFKDLKNLGIKIAISASDDRDKTERIINFLGIEKMIDITKCAKDPPLLPKPHSSNVDSICADTGVRPSKAVIVGNKPIDIKLGRNSKVGLTIGICPNGDCDLDADETINSITDIVPLLTELGNGKTS